MFGCCKEKQSTKEIHDGKVYDISTSIKVASGYNEFGYKKTLYKTKNSNFFYTNESTVLGITVGNCGMTSISVNEAEVWYNSLSEKLRSIEEVFGDLPEA